MLTFGSVCSGIEAASVAWEPFGWRAVWFAEVDKAASEVLAHRFPSTPNHGDMTALAAMVRRREIAAPDVLVGGTPCQSFSLAGLRRGLSDDRGQLTLAFVDLANAIDEVRLADCLPPCIIVWENVPGVLSSKDNAFGCFLAGLAGEPDPIEPGPQPEPGRSTAHWTWEKTTRVHRPKWTNAGAALGPERAIAWRTLDAQYFGLAQRRRRVFVVAGAGPGFDPAALLLEFDGVRRDTPPSRKAGEGVTHPVAPYLTSSGRGVERTGDIRGEDPVVAVYGNDSGRDADTSGDGNDGVRGPVGLNNDHLPVPTWWDGRDVSQTLDAVLHKGQTMPEKNRFPAVLHPVDTVYGFQPRIARNGRGDMGDLCNALTSQAGETGKGDAAPHVAVIPFDTSQITSPGNYSAPKAGDPCHPLAAGAHPPAIVVHGTQDPCVAYDHAWSLGRNMGQENVVCVTGSVTHTLRAEGFDASEDGTGRGQPIVPSFVPEIGGTLKACAGKSGTPNGAEEADRMIVYGSPPRMAVRRLMPVECERLQGFPDGWTLVPTGPKSKPAADGPRYKQLGNSMAVNVMRWIGGRIDAWVRLHGTPIGHNSFSFDEVLG